MPIVPFRRPCTVIWHVVLAGLVHGSQFHHPWWTTKQNRL